MKSNPMKLSHFLSAILPILAMAPLVPKLSAAPDATLTVRVDQNGAAISPTLYGIFFEEINRAGDGGIYAEMIQNRSFEDNPKAPDAWSGLGSESLSLDTDRPLNPRNPTSLRMDLTGDAGGVVNRGFSKPGAPTLTPYGSITEGLAIHNGEDYRLSLHARGGNGFGGVLTARLKSATGKTLASASISGIEADWKKHEILLKAVDGDAAAQFVLEGKGPGSVWVDMVSLFPRETWKNHGLRKDLAELVSAMKPRFVRFPGGCYVEGVTLSQAVRWKDTIGPVEERKGVRSIWRYQSTGGFGVQEFFQWCEDLGAEPLYVINCGISHEEETGKRVPVPGEEQDYLQDALDLIEYARGPENSRWGSLRAKAGHPAPFQFKYLEIGNENGGPLYHERFVLFQNAIKAKYPDMELIACRWKGGYPSNVPVDIVDEHYYAAPDFFRKEAGMYDSYDRKGPKVYVGEYAVTKQCGFGNAAAALGEAAFMTGLERNSDHVIMATYAPLFVNPPWKGWNPNAIVFDQGRAYGTPSYHVQALFANHVGDVVCPSELTTREIEEDIPSGGISLSSMSSLAEFKDIRVEQNGSILFDSKKTPGITPWRKVNSGKWNSVNGTLRQTNDKPATFPIAIGNAKWGTEYVLALKARKTGGNGGVLIGFQLRVDGDNRGLSFGGNKNTRIALEGMGGDHAIPGSMENDRWYDIRIELKGALVTCFLDGKQVLKQTQRLINPKPLFAVASRTKDGRELILKVVNTSSKPITTAIDIKGAKDVKPVGKGWLLAAGSDADENTFERPMNVAPVEIPVDNVTSRFERTFPAHSVTVLRLGMNP